MKIKNENGTKWISCDNLGELITEFKKFRNSKSAKEREGYSFGGGIGGGFMSMIGFKTVKLPNGKFAVSEIMDSVRIYQEKGVDLSLNLAPLNFKEKDWKPYNEKVKKILKEIWETDEVKDYQGLDLNWPADSEMVRCDQCGKNIGNGKLTWFSDREKDLDFCSEDCHAKWTKKHNSLGEETESLKEQLKKATNCKNIWMIISIAAISILVLALLFFQLKTKKLKKR